MSLRTKISSAGLVALLPVFALAQASFGGQSFFEGIADTFKNVVATLLPAFIGLAIIGFAYGLFVYLKGGAEDKEKGKSIMIWGALAVIILLSIYALANLFQSLLGVENANIDNAPTTLDDL
ncbi:MAG: hypothetical protein WC385_00740 [Candidatus Paceibacterota bacterium]|jgi:hypothetical protein